LNRNGRQDSLGRNPEFKENLEAMGSYYDIVERISAGYVMNTLNYGPDLTLIAGLRVENEENDYISRFSRGALTGFPVATGTVLDTSARHTETVWLPNFHLTYRPTEFLTIRGAIYKALARPDFSDRLERQIARSAGGTNISLFVGNPKLRAAQAWNYELNAMVYSGDLGLISVSGFYKEIKDMYRSVQGLPTKGNHMLDSLGIAWRTPFDTTVQYGLTFPLNSSSPTRVWGIEFEHQANLTWLPGLLSNLVLSYNFSLIRSETFVLATRVDTSYQIITVPGFPPIRVPIYSNNITESRQKLENQPEFFGNFAVGYDIDGFSARVSVFHQGSFKTLFSAYGRADQETDSYTRWDVSLKQRVTPNVSLLFNLNNFTNIEEATSIVNRNAGWDLLNTSRKYGLAADFGVRVDL
jgi:TonB-dependent receptor